MQIANKPEDEAERLSALYELDILDTPQDERFDRITRLATTIFEVPIAYIALIDANRQWFKSQCGMPAPETGRDVSLCSHAILQDEPLVIRDTHLDYRFYDNPLVVSDPKLRFYAGCPLKSPDGHNIATLCIADDEPRDLSKDKLQELIDLALLVEDQLALVSVAAMQRNMRLLKNKIQEANRDLETKNAFIRGVFGRYMTDAVAETVLKSPEALKLGGDRRKVTVLMGDIRGFTTISEKLPAEEVVKALNTYLEAMVEVVSRYGGIIDSFIGDGILVLFGAPIAREDDAQRAVACAVDMQLAMQRVNAEQHKLGLPEFQIGIGINTGEVIAGNIGSEKRMKYSVIGSPVNVAARVESLTLGGQILVTESTLAEVKSIARIDGRLRVKVKGLNGCIQIHDIGGIAGNFNVFLPPPSILRE